MRISPIQERIDFILPFISDAGLEKTIIDLGCGTGMLSAEIAKRCSHRVIGIDLDEENISIAKNNNPQGEYICADIIDASLPRADVIICSEVLEHLDEPGKLLNKIKENLKDDGRLIITIPNGYGPWELFENQPLEFIRNAIDGKPTLQRMYYGLRDFLYLGAKDSLNSGAGSRHVQRFSVGEIKSLLEKIGFKVCHIENNHFFVTLLPFRILKEKFVFLYSLDRFLCRFIPFWLSSGWGVVAKIR